MPGRPPGQWCHDTFRVRQASDPRARRRLGQPALDPRGEGIQFRYFSVAGEAAAGYAGSHGPESHRIVREGRLQLERHHPEP